MAHFPGLMVQQDVTPQNRILGYLTQIDPMADENIGLALDEIEKSLDAIINKSGIKL